MHFLIHHDRVHQKLSVVKHKMTKNRGLGEFQMVAQQNHHATYENFILFHSKNFLNSPV
jgi:hypothetical protein